MLPSFCQKISQNLAEFGSKEILENGHDSLMLTTEAWAKTPGPRPCPEEKQLEPVTPSGLLDSTWPRS